MPVRGFVIGIHATKLSSPCQYSDDMESLRLWNSLGVLDLWPSICCLKRTNPNTHRVWLFNPPELTTQISSNFSKYIEITINTLYSTQIPSPSLSTWRKDVAPCGNTVCRVQKKTSLEISYSRRASWHSRTNRASPRGRKFRMRKFCEVLFFLVGSFNPFEKY